MIAKKNQRLLQLAIDRGLHRQFKVRCVEADTTMNEQVERLIRAWLRNKK